MAGPIDAVTAIHNAFRHDIALVDAAALESVRGKPGLEATVERFRNMTRSWQMGMPPEGFAMAAELIEQVVGDEWHDLAAQIPDLVGA